MHNNVSFFFSNIIILLIIIGILHSFVDGRTGHGRGKGRGGARNKMRAGSSNSKKVDDDNTFSFRGGYTHNGIRIKYFSGGGSGRSSSKLVDSQMIKATYFTVGTSALIFLGHDDKRVKKLINMNDTEIIEDNNNDKIEELVIAQPEKPVMISSPSLAYFWGEEFLPENDKEECVTYETSNNQGDVKYCNISRLHRCNRPISQLSVFHKKRIIFDDGESPSTIVWLCPLNRYCCEWECCEINGDHSFDWNTVITILVLLVILLVPFVCVAVGKEMQIRRRKRKLTQLDNSMRSIEEYDRSRSQSSQPFISPPITTLTNSEPRQSNRTSTIPSRTRRQMSEPIPRYTESSLTLTQSDIPESSHDSHDISIPEYDNIPEYESIIIVEPPPPYTANDESSM